MKTRVSKTKMKVAMIKKGMKIKDLVEASGKTAATIYRMMNNEGDVRLDTYADICRILGVKLDDLVEVEND